jgi:hypothetical protein
MRELSAHARGRAKAHARRRLRLPAILTAAIVATCCAAPSANATDGTLDIQFDTDGIATIDTSPVGSNAGITIEVISP